MAAKSHLLVDASSPDTPDTRHPTASLPIPNARQRGIWFLGLDWAFTHLLAVLSAQMPTLTFSGCRLPWLECCLPCNTSESHLLVEASSPVRRCASSSSLDTPVLVGVSRGELVVAPLMYSLMCSLANLMSASAPWRRPRTTLMRVRVKVGLGLVRVNTNCTTLMSQHQLHPVDESTPTAPHCL